MPLESPADDLAAWLRLSLETGLGPRRALKLLRAAGSPAHLYKMPATLLSRYMPPNLAHHLASPLLPHVAEHINRSLAWVEAENRHIITLADDRYPPLLLTTADPPLLLYVRGNPATLTRPSVAIVGARNATMGGAENARAFACYLAAHNWCVVSGLAQGIDAAAHEGALKAGLQGASTIALMGTGIDLIYPRHCQALAERIAIQGALVSELPLGSPPKPYHFPKRNRLIAGISRGILVVEASRQSGSLITAQLAVDNGREVFALPGSIHAPLSRGCHALIQQGATLVESARDILNELHPVTHQPISRVNVKRNGVTRLSQSSPKADMHEPTPHLSSETQRVLTALGYEPVHVDILVARTHLDSPRLATELLKLELDGLVERLAGGYFQRLKNADVRSKR